MAEAASAAALLARDARRRAMLPGSPRDRRVAAARILFPLAAFLLFAALILWPLSTSRELSFLLSKDAAGEAGERMRLTGALYRGTTTRGEPFELSARSAVQKTSQVPVVVLQDLRARIEQADGPAVMTARSGLYNLETDRLQVSGPIEVAGAGGYRLDARDVTVDLATRTVVSADPVSGELPMGRFSAERFTAELDGRRVVLEGRVKLRLEPGRHGG